MKEYPLINFYELTLPKEPHYCLVYYKQLKGDPQRQMIAPIFNCEVEKLLNAWQQVMRKQPRTKLINQNLENYQLQYVQRSFLFRFPDIIDVQFNGLAENKSTVYCYSRSVYGYSDLGVNCKRLKKWLQELRFIVGQ